MRLTWILKLLVGLGVLFAVGVGLGVLLVVGFVSTRLLVSDGVDRFAEEQRAIAQEALFSAQVGCLDHPIASVMIPKIRVVEVKLEPGRCPTWLSIPTQDYRAILRAYTFFRIPIGSISVCGNETDCRGLFWPRRLEELPLGEWTR